MSLERKRASHAPSLPIPSPFPRKPPLLPILVVTAGILLALFLWTFPNWGAFSSTYTQLAELWQESGNRLTIIALLIKIVSPLLLALLLGACFWLWYSIKPFLLQEEDIPSETARPEQQLIAFSTGEEGREASPPVEQPALCQSEQIILTPATPPLSAPFLPQEQQPEGREEKADVQGSVARKRLSPHVATLMQRRRQRLYGRSVRIGGQATPSTTPEDVPMTAVTSEAIPPARSSSTVSITLLKEVTLTLHAPGGINRLVPLSLNAKRVQLLAYIAWMRGEPLKDTMPEIVYGFSFSLRSAGRDTTGIDRP